MTPLDILYESVKNRITIDKELFKQNLHNWNAIGLYEKGELIGCVIQRENDDDLMHWPSVCSCCQ